MLHVLRRVDDDGDDDDDDDDDVAAFEFTLTSMSPLTQRALRFLSDLEDTSAPPNPLPLSPLSSTAS